MFNVLFIDDRAEETKRRIAEFTEEGLLGQDNNFKVDVLGPASFEEMGKQLFSMFTNQSTYQALMLDWNLSEVPQDGFTAGYRAAELGQYLRREIAEKEQAKLCFPIFVLSAQRYIKDLYNKDKASHDIFDSVYEREEFFIRKANPDIVSEITLFIKAYDKLHEIYDSNPNFADSTKLELKNILALLLNKAIDEIEKSINFNELNIPHPYGYIKFIHHELIKKAGPLVDKRLASARLGIAFGSFDSLMPYLVSAKYTGIMHEGYDRWWMKGIEEWWKSISSDPLVFLDADERVAAINDKLGLELKPAESLGNDYSTFYWHLSTVTHTPLDEADAIRLLGSKKFDWQEYKYLSKADYSSGAYEIRPNEYVDNDEVISKLN
jgi:hypothetical protein